MNLFGQESVTLTLERNQVQISDKKTGTQVWKFPEGSVINQEVRDPEKLIVAWQQYWQSLNIKNAQVLVVLSNSVVFSKNMDAEDPKFFETVPIETNQMVGRTVFVFGKVVMMATNGTLINLLMQGIENAGSHVFAAVPVSLVTNKQTIRAGNFLGDPNQSQNNQKSNSKLWIWFVIGGVWILLIGAVLLRLLGKI